MYVVHSFCSATDMNNFFVDRVITITGSPENTSKAEALVSEKMRKCFEQDAQNYNVSVKGSPLHLLDRNIFVKSHLHKFGCFSMLCQHLKWERERDRQSLLHNIHIKRARLSVLWFLTELLFNLFRHRWVCLVECPPCLIWCHRITSKEDHLTLHIKWWAHLLLVLYM